MDWEQIAAMEQSGLLRFGSHTRTHTRLRAGIDAALLNKEVDGSLAELAPRLQQPVTGFCYPNGDYCPEAVQQVGSNYQYAVSTQRGWNTVQSNRLFMKRLTVQSNDGLKGRLLARCLITLSRQTEPQHHD